MIQVSHNLRIASTKREGKEDSEEREGVVVGTHGVL